MNSATRSRLQGFSAKPLATGRRPGGFVSDGERLLWVESDPAQPQSNILSVARSGGTVASLASRASLVGQIEMTDDALWWVEFSSATAPGSVVRAGRDGSSPRVVVADVPDFARFEISGETLAIDTSSGLTVGPTSGGARRDVVTGASMRGFAMHGETVYFAREDACVENTMVGNGEQICKGKIFSMPTSGGAPRELHASAGPPSQLIVDSACIYFLEVIGQCHPGCSTGLGVLPR